MVFIIRCKKKKKLKEVDKEEWNFVMKMLSKSGKSLGREKFCVEIFTIAEH